MKKIILLVLALAMIFTVACSNSEPLITEETEETETRATTTEDKGVHNADGVFAVGFGREDITPDSMGVGLAGYANAEYRLSKKVLDRIYVTAVAMRDENGTVGVICTCDVCGVPENVALSIRQYFVRNGNVPENNIIISATHTHAGPAFINENAMWTAKFTRSVVNAIKGAIADLDKAEVYIGDLTVDGMNYIRRYKTKEGGWSSVAGTGTRIAHETDPDTTLQVMKFDRENQKDIVIVNWGAHPCFTGGENAGDISADYIGQLRKNFEKQNDAYCAFWQAAAGNLTTTGSLSGEQPYSDNYTYGKKLTENVNLALQDLTKVESGKIAGDSKVIELNIDHSKDKLVPEASAVNSLLKSGKLNEARALAKEYGFDTMYEARDIVAKSSMGKTGSIPVYVLTVGNVAFAGAPYEMFDTNGMEVKKASPYEMTFICELSNGSYSYIPSSLAFPHGGYEVTSCKYERGVGEKLANGMIDMLNTLHG